MEGTHACHRGQPVRWETADSLAALREARKRGFQVLGIVNRGRQLHREGGGQCILYMGGPEISVATTKAYSTQLAAMYLIGIHFGKVRGVVSGDEYAAYLKEL